MTGPGGRSISGTNEFAGDKVRLRALEPEDAEAWRAWGLDTDLDRMGNFTRFPSTREAYRRRVDEASKLAEADGVVLTIETLDGTVVGCVNTRSSPRTRIFDFGIGLGRDHFRQGYGTEALRLLFRFYFSELGYQKVETGIYAFNEPSLRFHEAFGFVVEGRRRRAVFTRGEYHELVLVGMTAEEFAARHG